MQALRLVEQERGIKLQTLIEAIQEALLKAYYNQPGAIHPARVDFDIVTGRLAVLASEKDENGEVIGEFDDTPNDFGRIATSIVRSIIMQRLLEAEDAQVIGAFKDKLYTVVSGVIQQTNSGNPNVMIDLGGVEAIMPEAEQVPNEQYNHGDRIRVYVIEVSRGHKGPRIVVSRTHPALVQNLFKKEVPEIQDGLIEIVSIAREAGHRTKIAVKATREGVNATGACIGPMGHRVRAVMSELNGEKIDIIDYSVDSAKYVANALSPARVSSAMVVDAEQKIAKVVVPNFQLSLAIGKDGQNARLAARLTGWKIDIQSDTKEYGDIQTSTNSTPDQKI